MKIFKEKQHSFFPRPLFIKGKLYLSMAVMVFFDLTDSENLLTEQELWKTVPSQLGPKSIIDQGVPKPRGEYLVTGSCHAPRGKARPASQVRVRVGDLEKKLNVFGDRYWKKGVITDPEPFTEIPVIWPNAYGGDGFKRNPLGKGIHKLPMPDGSMRVPLPNFELPDHQIGSPGDSPNPAGFGPLDLMWPQRFDKNGTYDDKWKAERWPYFPDDMNYEFFNQACEDQFLGGYFKGGEPVTIENMHPDMPVIETSLPRLSMRTFVTLNPDFKPYTFPVGPLPSHQMAENEVFKEVPTRLETLWLFPSIMRGLLMYRGTIEIKDEEYGDVLRVFIRHEELGEKPETIEHYRDEQIKLLDRGVDIDMTPLNDALQKAEKSMVTLKNIPKFADKIRQKALGKTPTMPTQEPEEVLAKSKAMLAEHSKRIDELEAMTRKMHAENGHRVEINLGVFDKFRGKIKQMGQKIEQTTIKLSATKKELEATRVKEVGEMSGKLKAIKPEYLEKAGFDPDEALPPDFPFHKKVNPWHDRGFPLVVQCRKKLDDDRQTLRKLTVLGLSRKTIKHAWLGVNSGELAENTEDWGLDKAEDFTIPAGLVLPRFDGPVLNRILCLKGEPADNNEFLVPGADEDPLFLPSSTLIDLPTMPAAAGAPIVCVPNELQALFLEQEVGDCCSIIALSSPGDKPGKDAADALKNAQVFLVVQPEKWEQDKNLKAQWDDWKDVSKVAEPMELEHGTTVFQSRKKGSDIRQWVFDHLPKDYGNEHSVALTKLENGKPPDSDFLKGFKPKFPDIKGLTKGIYGEVKEAMDAKFAPVKAQRDELLAQMKKAAAKHIEHGVDPEKITLDPPAGAKQSFGDMGKEMASKIRGHAARLEKHNQLTPELAKKMEAGAARAEKLGAKADIKQAAMTEQLKAKKLELEGGLKKLKAMEPPDELKAKLREHGIDPDKIKPLTREQVQRFHDQGKSLAGYILAGVDLSALDLSGADFTGCRVAGADFSGATLDETRFDQAMGKGANFTKASLKGAVMERAILQKAIFAEADLTGVKARQAAFKGSDFTGATLAGADLDMAILEKTDFTGANLTGARINMCIVTGKADNADFRQAQVSKVMFKKTTLDNVDFRKATVNSSLFNGAKGKKVNFAGANLDKMKTGRNSEFPEADFTKTTLRQAGLRETDFTGSDFRQADLEGAMIDNSILKDTDFNRAYAKNARLTKSDFEGASMRAFNLHMGSMRKSRLVDTDLRGSNFFSVDFYKSVLGNSRFEGANLKRSQLQDRLDLLDEKE